nr:MAG TPA: hypothetical protein [Bacteriophage sp.]
MLKDAKRVDVIETTPDKVESYIEAYKRGEIVDLPPLLESEEIKEISVIGGKAIIYVIDKKRRLKTMIKKVIKLTTTVEMIENDINELINNSDIDQPMLEDTECVIGYTVIKEVGTLYVLVNIGEK